MIVETSPVQIVFNMLEQSFSCINRLLSNNSQQQLNSIPFKHSWTLAQVADHVTKSTISIARAMNMDAQHCKREPDEKIAELRKMFLNFTVKYISPEFILPDKQVYAKEAITASLQHSFEQLKLRANVTDISGMIQHPSFGDITKLELIYFVLFHTQRHLYQMNNILHALKE